MIPPGRAATTEQKRAMLDKLLEVWETAPQLRLGQLIDNALYTNENGYHDSSLFQVEDDRLMMYLENFKNKFI